MSEGSAPPRPQGLKAPTGIEGFDEMTGGGLPRERTTLVLGNAGTGKTVFGLQTLVNGARLYDEPGIFVAIEEESRQIIENAESFGWDIPSLVPDRLFFLDAHISPDLVHAGDFDLIGMLVGLEAKAREMKARRIVFDSLDVLLALLDNRAAERQELYRIHDWLSRSGLTGIITSGTQGPDPLTSQNYGFMQFMADCVVMLQHRQVDRVSSREIRIAKYRGSAFQENELPMVIGEWGIQIATLGVPQTKISATSERVSTGIERLDTMLGGGFHRSSSALITGAPGTSKTTLAAAFVEAACKRGERALYVSFDESPEEIVRNLTSVGIDLASHIESGRLLIFSGRSEMKSAEEHLVELKRLMRRHDPQCMVIDPISALMKAGGRLNALAVAQRILWWAKTQGITLVLTSLLEGSLSGVEATELQISTVADSWIHLTYLVQAGERNRALTIVKSRGTKHSNQVRELVLSSQGVTLEDVYMTGGEVLMGTLRWEKEQAAEALRERNRLEQERRHREVEQREAEIQARMTALARELDALEFEHKAIGAEGAAESEQYASDLAELGRRRSADPTDDHPSGTDPFGVDPAAGDSLGSDAASREAFSD